MKAEKIKSFLMPGETILWSHLPDEGTPPDFDKVNKYIRWASWLFLPIWIYLIYIEYQRSSEAFFESLPRMIGFTVLYLVAVFLVFFISKRLPDFRRQRTFNYVVFTDQRVILLDWLVEDIAILSRDELVSVENDYAGGSPAIAFRRQNDLSSYVFVSGQSLKPLWAVLNEDQARKPLAPNL